MSVIELTKCNKGGAMNKRFACTLLALSLFPISLAMAAPPAKSSTPGKIVGQIAIPCGASAAAGVLVYIPGRSFVAITGTSGSFELSSIPHDTYLLHGEVANPTRAIELPNVVVTSGQTTDVGTLTVNNLSSDVNNCGQCGNVCPASGGTPICVSGVCQVQGGSACTGDANCSSGVYCGAGNICKAKNSNGEACTASNQCVSGN